VKKSLKLSLGSVVVAGALGAVLVPAATASATEGFVCPADTDTVPVPAAFAADGTPILAGTVCLNVGTTVLNSVDVSDGWSAQVKSDGTASNARTDVRFTEPSTGDRVELRYEPGKTEIR
jgi:hypothetical protein